MSVCRIRVRITEAVWTLSTASTVPACLASLGQCARETWTNVRHHRVGTMPRALMTSTRTYVTASKVCDWLIYIFMVRKCHVQNRPTVTPPTCPILESFRPTVLGSGFCVIINFLMS